jgi:hypothetical protein
MLSYKATSKWLQAHATIENVAKDPSRFNNETIDEIIDLIQDAAYGSSAMYNVTKMYLDMSSSIKIGNAYKVLLNCNNLTGINDVYDLRERCNNLPYNQTYTEEIRDRLWEECEHSSVSTMALMTFL